MTDAADDHPDHKAAFALVHAAAISTGFTGTLFTSSPTAVSGDWPWPQGAAPDTPLDAHSVPGSTYPEHVHGRPPVRVA